jgi:hypothetical protein
VVRSKYYNIDHELKGPYRVEKLNQMLGRHENLNGISPSYDNIEMAIKVAREITKKSIKQCGSIARWSNEGMAGLVYDAQGFLVWHGVLEYTRKRLSRLKEIV